MPRYHLPQVLLPAIVALVALGSLAWTQDDSAVPSRARGEAHTRPVKLPSIKPPTLTEDRVAVKLPSTFVNCVVGGGGRYLIFHLKQLRQLAVFDTTEAKVIKYLPLGSDDVAYAAGAEKLVIVLRDQKIVQRWDLARLEKELTKTIAKPEQIVNVVMGSASNGPIFFGGGDFYNNGQVFLDLATLEESAIKGAPNGHWRVGGGGDTILRASANGMVFGMMRIGTSPSGLQDIVITGNQAQVLYEHDSVGVITPSPDGQLLYTGDGVYTTQLKLVGTNSPRGAIPSVHGDFYVLAATGDLRFNRGDDNNDESISIHLAGDSRPLVTLPGLAKDLKTAGDRSNSQGDWGLQRVYFIPDAHLLLLLPPSNDQVVLHRLNLDEALEKSEVDYLFVQSRPPQEALAGQTWTYQPLVKSKRGTVKIQVASGPEGMQAAASGAVSWTVPKDAPPDPINVILSVSDASGQEVFQTFPLTVKGGAPSTAVAQTSPPAAKTKTGRMKAGPPDTKNSPAEAAAAAIRAAAQAAAQAAKGAADAASADAASAPASESTAPAADAPAEVTLPQIEPVKFTGDELPGAASDFIAARGGKLLLAHLKQLRQIAILDVSRGEIVKYLPVGSDDVLMAAGASKLVVLLRDKNILQRYNLETFERELSVTTPTTDTITSMVMGSASAGPVLMTTGRDDFGGQIKFLDPATIKLIDYKMAGQQQGFFMRGGSGVFGSRASANGRIFATGETVLSLSDATVTPLGGGFNQRAWGLVPNIDGTILYSAGGMFNSDMKQIGSELPGGIPIPAVQGGYYVLVAGEPFTGIGSGGKLPSVSIHVEGDKRPLLTLSGVFAEVVDRSRYDFNQGVPLDKRLWFIPDAHLLVEVRSTLDSLILHRVNLERLLEKSEVDYLFVASRPPLTAAPSKELSYQLVVKAKRGGVKYELAAGPEGMSVSEMGLVKWTVPADAGGTRHQVIIGVRDALDQEVFHSFTIGVSGGPKPVATTRPATSPRPATSVRPSTAIFPVPPTLPAGTIPLSPEKLKAEATLARQEVDRHLQQVVLEQRQMSRAWPKFPPRSWTDADGNQIEAQLVESFAGMATLRKTDGQTLLAVVAQLSAEDQKYLKDLATAAAEARKKGASSVTPEAESIARLKTIGIGIHNFHDTYKVLIPAHSVDGERPLLSWRVHLLPFIGGQKLHALFRFDEPWDSEHNRQLVEFMPTVYAAAGSKAGPGKTNFLAVRGEGAVFPDVVAGQAHNFASVRDGTSNTIMIVEASDPAAQEWTKPEDWPWTQEDPLKNLIGLRKGGFFALFVDGHIELVSDQNDPETLNRIFGRGEGLPAELKRAAP